MSPLPLNSYEWMQQDLCSFSSTVFRLCWNQPLHADQDREFPWGPPMTPLCRSPHVNTLAFHVRALFAFSTSPFEQIHPKPALTSTPNHSCNSASYIHLQVFVTACWSFSWDPNIRTTVSTLEHLLPDAKIICPSIMFDCSCDLEELCWLLWPPLPSASAGDMSRIWSTLPSRAQATPLIRSCKYHLIIMQWIVSTLHN